MHSYSSSSRVSTKTRPKCCIFKHDDLIRATNNFSEFLGKGGFGSVYRGKIGRKLVAVKCMIRPSRESQDYFNILKRMDDSFQTEIKLLEVCDHVNIISLVGYCEEGDDQKFLVYELMPNRSLYDHLHNRKSNPDDTTLLTVEQRLEICLGVAEGLRYLHSGPGRSIIHSDLKTDNILLDSKFVPKLADFGLSRSRVTNRLSPTTEVTNRQAGTRGYMAPECYKPNHKQSRKIDVYAFGVVLLEVLSEEIPFDTLVGSGLNYIMKGILKEFTAEYVNDNISPRCVRACENIIKECLEHDPDKRPTMDDVVTMVKSALELQKQSRDQQVFEEPQLALAIPEGFNDRVVLYHTSSGVVMKTKDDSQDVRNILDTYGKRVDERDVYLNPLYKTQLKKIFGSTPYMLPQLFIRGKYIGGTEEVRKLYLNGDLREMLRRIPKIDYQSDRCATCENTRFASLSLCPECSSWKNDQSMDHGLD